MPRKHANLSLVDVLTPARNPFETLFETEAVAVNSAQLGTDHGVM